MALELSGPKRKELREALMDAFPSWAELERMLSDQLDWRLATITASAKDLAANTFDLIQWAQARGYLAELIEAARNQNPRNPKLELVAASVSLSSAAGVQPKVLEKIVSTNTTFLDVAKWREGLVRTEWCVCRVDAGGEGEGTGFLVGPDLVMTNFHVIQSLVQNPTNAASWSCRFDHKLSEAGDVISMGRVVKLATEWRVDDSPYSRFDLVPDPKPGTPSDDELDFALLRLAEPIGDQPIGRNSQSEEVRGFIKIPGTEADFANLRVLAILQHPYARPMKLALGMDESIEMNSAKNRIRYKVPTEGGSSGSPVFDGDWNLVALHHSGDPETVNPLYNEGIPITRIAARPKVAAALPK